MEPQTGGKASGRRFNRARDEPHGRDSSKINPVPHRLTTFWRRRAADTLETNVGAWGAGLYSSDMAADMRAVIKSALRLPFDEDRIVDILSDCERHAATDPNNEDHTTFWLVLADQFEKRSVAHAPTREKAIGIIDRGDDIMMMEKLGMKQADRRKRSAKLAELRARLAAAPRPSKPRATIKA